MPTDTYSGRARAFERASCEEAPRLLHLAWLLTGNREAAELALVRSLESLDLTCTSTQNLRWRTSVIAESYDLVDSQLRASINCAETSHLKRQQVSFDLPSPAWSAAHDIHDDDVDTCLLMMDVFPRWSVVLRTLFKFSIYQISLFLQVDPELVDETHRTALSELTRNLAIVRGWMPGAEQPRLVERKQLWMVP